MIRTCKKHGETRFRNENKKDGNHWRCCKCGSEATQKRRDTLKQMAIQHLGGSCSVCGYSKCSAALDFHHKDPAQKDFAISAKGHTRSWDKVKIELDKCVLVCANCHREIHYSSCNKLGGQDSNLQPNE